MVVAARRIARRRPSLRPPRPRVRTCDAPPLNYKLAKRPARERGLNGGQHLAGRKLVKAAAETVDVMLAADALAGKTGERVLDDPHVAAALNRPGVVPGLRHPVDRPWADAARACGPVKTDRRAAAGRRQVRHRRVGTDIDD